MKKQTGLTLIEIMVALVLGLIVVGAAMQIYIGTVKSSGDTLKSTRLNHDLELVMSLMMNDIRRAGYWSNARMEADSRSNPFTISSSTITTKNFAPTDITIMNATDTNGTTSARVVGDCILYSYDADANGHYDNNTTDTTYVVDDTTDFYGFRLNNGSLQMQISGTTTNDCTSSANWESIIDDNKILITDLRFSFVPLNVDNTWIDDTSDPDDLQGTSHCSNFTKDVYYPVTTGTTTAANTPATCTQVDAAGGISTNDDVTEKRVVNIVLTGVLDENGDNIKNANEVVTKTLRGTIKIANNRVFSQP